MSETPPPACRVGVCDDVAAFRQVLALVLEFEPDIELVGQAGNGLEALELVTAEQVDVLLLDLAMPVMDGMEALPRIRDAAPDTSVIMLTGFGTSEIRERALANGACRFIEKGIPPGELIKAIREVCAA